MRAVDIVRQVAPRALIAYREAFEHGDALLAQHGITTPARIAHFLAQCAHETGGFTIARESGNYRAERILQIFGAGRHSAAVTPAEAKQLEGNGPALFERVYGLGNQRKAKELGNTQPGDGWKYRGGGILQTTGRANYRRMGQKCGVDFEGHPEYVTSAQYALVPALTEWTEGNLNAAADADDIRAITRKINGGFNGLADRQNWFARIRPLCDDVAPPPEPEPEQQAEPDAPPYIPPVVIPPSAPTVPAPAVPSVPWYKRAWTYVASSLFGGGMYLGGVQINAQTILAICVLLVVLGVGAGVYFLGKHKGWWG